ncbi:MAG: hypothetical protein ACK4YT_14040, partial [Sphingomonas sp.]
EMVAASAWLPKASVELATAAWFERREVAVAAFRAADHMAAVRVSDDDLRAYFEQHADAFRSPEQARRAAAALRLHLLRNVAATRLQSLWRGRRQRRAAAAEGAADVRTDAHRAMRVVRGRAAAVVGTALRRANARALMCAVLARWRVWALRRQSQQRGGTLSARRRARGQEGTAAQRTPRGAG